MGFSPPSERFEMPETARPNGLTIVAARLRLPLLVLFFLLIVLGLLIDLPAPWRWLTWLVIALWVVCSFVIGRVRGEPVRVRFPVTGRWRALNSPASRVPSHGMHTLGQTYAIDLVHEPTDRSRPTFGSDAGFRRPGEFPAFGQPILAPADGVVVRAKDGARDHRARNSLLGVLYLLVEGVFREISGVGRVLGNHVVLDIGDGAHATLAHLRRGSLRVAVGERVVAAQQLAECGNSGNSTEPHIHVQLMDISRPGFAAGLPVTFGEFEVDGSRQAGVPRNGEVFTVSPKPV